jgi:hypothetical protein
LQRRGLRLAVVFESPEVAEYLGEIVTLVRLDRVIAVCPSVHAARAVFGFETEPGAADGTIKVAGEREQLEPTAAADGPSEGKRTTPR